ncbi:hypothetical protein [Halobacillus salinus]|uniref:Uncharacterized protein n=1 Tax=Halobacillus salinus TaxID=192814 RepID=A0A4Z0GX53_9BACI|nr:hypothetical protein [Halobacillus salinus]TGB01109.1 hypothetical protein E4663_18330 [Halobacillus salinus]
MLMMQIVMNVLISLGFIYNTEENRLSKLVKGTLSLGVGWVLPFGFGGTLSVLVSFMQSIPNLLQLFNVIATGAVFVCFNILLYNLHNREEDY